MANAYLVASNWIPPERMCRTEYNRHDCSLFQTMISPRQRRCALHRQNKQERIIEKSFETKKENTKVEMNY